MRYLSLTWSPETEVGVYTREQVRDQLNSCMSWNTPVISFIASKAVYEKTPVGGFDNCNVKDRVGVAECVNRKRVTSIKEWEEGNLTG